MAKRPVTALTVILEVGVALVVAALAGGAAWLVWGVSGIAFGAASIAIGTAGQTLFTQKRWAAGIMLIAIAALASFSAFILLLPKPTAPPPPIARSPMLLPGVRPWPNGVVPVCWLNRPERGTASSDDLRMILAVKGAEEAWSAAGAVSFHDVGACPSEFHGVRLLIGRTIDDPDSPALGSALADQDRPVTVPFVFPSRGGCSSGGRFGSADVCAL